MRSAINVWFEVVKTLEMQIFKSLTVFYLWIELEWSRKSEMTKELVILACAQAEFPNACLIRRIDAPALCFFTFFFVCVLFWMCLVSFHIAVDAELTKRRKRPLIFTMPGGEGRGTHFHFAFFLFVFFSFFSFSRNRCNERYRWSETGTKTV